MEKDQKRKLQLHCDDDVWGKVADYKITKGLKNNNEAVNKLIKKGLLYKDDD